MALAPVIIGGISIGTPAASLEGDATPPASSTTFRLNRLGSIANAGLPGSEVVAFEGGVAYSKNGAAGTIDRFAIASDGTLSALASFDLTGLPDFGEATSVAVKNGIVAVVHTSAAPATPGHATLLDAATGSVLNMIEVGIHPDMATFSPDGSKLLVANEGERSSETDTSPGTISIIDLSRGAGSAAVTGTVGFSALDGSEALLVAQGLALYPGESASNDIEPEYITVTPDGTTAYVTLQEVNAVAKIDLTDPAATAPVAILPLGSIDRLLPGNAFDGNDDDEAIGLLNVDVASLPQPDAIASFEAGGATYFVTANEGDARVELSDEERLEDYLDRLDPAAYPDAQALGELIGRLNIITSAGDTDADGDIDQITTFGGRGISIFRQNEDGTIDKVRETGGEFEAIIARDHPELHNSENLDDPDSRSDNKGPEPEGVTVGRIGDRLYAIVNLERVGGVMVYDVTEPENASFVTYAPATAEDLAPETSVFVDAASSPTGAPLVLTANEDSGTVTVYEAALPAAPSVFTLQLLHFSDSEAGLLASQTAPYLAALADSFEESYGNSITLASGDLFLPGPFLAGGTDASVAAAINAVTGSTISGSPAPAVADIAIHNLIGVQASAIGNHEFDLGSNVLGAAFGAGGGWVGAAFPYMSANLDFSGDGALAARYTETVGTGGLETAASLAGRLAPSAVIEENGELIGLVAATTQILEQISSPSGTEVEGFPTGPGANGETNDMALLAGQLQPAIDDLIAQGVNKIILMSHLQQLDLEEALAPLLTGVDIIVAGGSHTRLGDADDAAVDFPGHASDFADTYPIVTADAARDATLIVNTDSEYTYLGRLVVDFDADGDIIADSVPANVAVSGAYASTAENVAQAWGVSVDDLEATAFAEGTRGNRARQLTEAVQEVIDVKDGNVFGYSAVYLEGERSQVRAQETNLGNVSADANAFAARGALGLDATDAIVSIKNGGGIRAQIGTIVNNPDGTVTKVPPPGGEVSQLDTENALRFDNGLMAFDTTAAGLLAILNSPNATTAGNGGFIQVGGLRFSYDPALAPGSRVRDVALTDEAGRITAVVADDGAVAPGAPDLITGVVLNFTANGGDGYLFKQNAENFRYLLADGTLSAPVDEALDFTAEGVAPPDLLGEQQAFADYFAARHPTPDKAFAQADVPAELDSRIQNQAVRPDTVLDGTYLVEGTPGDDLLPGTAQADDFAGKAGFDTVDYSQSADSGVAAFLAQVDCFGISGQFAGTPAGGHELPSATGISQSAGDSYSSVESLIGTDYRDLVYGSGSGTVARLGGGDDVFDNHHPSHAQDKVYGEGGNDWIYTGGGTDWLFGGAGLDHLYGEAGADFLAGGSGADVLEGGAGADTYAYGLTADDGADVIKGFVVGEDRILLQGGANPAELTLTAVGDDLVVAYAGLYSFSATLIGLGDEAGAVLV